MNKKDNSKESILKKLYSSENITAPNNPRFQTMKIIALSLIFGFLAGIVADFVSNAYLMPQYSLTKDSIINDISTLIDRRKTDTSQKGVLEEDIKKSIEETKTSIVSIYEKKSLEADSDKAVDFSENIYLPSDKKGSGIILTSDGWIVTSKKVITDLNKDYVLFNSNNEKYDVSEFISDPSSDLLFFKVKSENLQVMAMGEKNSLSLGDIVAAVESKNAWLSSIKNLNYKNIDKKENAISSTEKFDAFISLNTTLDKSFLGGAVVNLEGEMIGLINDNMVLPSDYIVRAMKDVIKDNKVKRAYLGVNYYDLSYFSLIDQSLVLNKSKGALIKEIAANSPAISAGLKTGDLVLKVNNEEIDENNSLNSLIQEYQAKDKINLTVLRADKEMTMEVMLGEYVK